MDGFSLIIMFIFKNSWGGVEGPVYEPVKYSTSQIFWQTVVEGSTSTSIASLLVLSPRCGLTESAVSYCQYPEVQIGINQDFINILSFTI